MTILIVVYLVSLPLCWLALKDVEEEAKGKMVISIPQNILDFSMLVICVAPMLNTIICVKSLHNKITEQINK